MADPIVSAITQTLVENLASAAMREIARIGGLNDDLQALQNTFEALQAHVEDAEMHQRKTASQKNWLRKLKDVAYDVEAVLDLMQYEDLKRRGKLFPSFGLRFRIKMANQVKNVRKKLDAIANDKNIFPPKEGVVENRFGVMKNETWQTGSLVTESEIYGRHKEKETILDKLLHDNRDCLSVLAICGMGGLGKTTLAQIVYNDERVEKHFDLRMWVCVSDDFHVQRLVTKIIQCVGPPCDKSEFDQLQSHLRQSLMGKRFLLVLDDVWNENPMLWDGLRQTLSCDSKGSVVLVTTRNKEVATMMAASYIHDIGCLSEEHSWSLFQQRAFSTGDVDENLVPIGKSIVCKCQGVPLSIKAIGSMMLGITSESDWLAVDQSGIWDQLDNKNLVTPAIRLSYYNLDLQLRQCFAYCCIFPKDFEMEENRLIQLWIANGFILSGDRNDVFSTGHSIFRKLAWRSFFQEIKKDDEGNVTCKMHDLMHDLASSIMEEETYVVERGMEIKIPKQLCHLYFTKEGFNDVTNQYGKFTLSTSNSLRSFIIDSRSSDVQQKDFISFLSRQQFLRVLELQFQVNLSKLFGKLKHLKHLVMSCENMKRLPNSLTSLYNLQTLKLMHSHWLLELPNDLRVMKKLCCLEMESYYSLLCSPPELGELTCLCRLSIFIVGENTSQQIHQLEKLKLGGNLFIKGLDNVSNLGDAKSADLINKTNLTSLTLHWPKENAEKHGECADEVLKGLQPHHNLEEIFVSWYPGSEFSDWMGSTAFKKMNKVSLYQCKNCGRLPALGRLPSLTHLYLEEINSVRSIGVEFLGDVKCSFPVLKSLKIDGMSKLEDWNIPDSVRCFPCLTVLSIQRCPELKRLPSLGKLSSLTDLLLQDMNSVMCLGVEFLGDVECSFPALTSLKISGMLKLEDWSIPDSMRSFPCLTELEIESCPELKRLPCLGKLPSLTDLVLQDVNSVMCLGVEWFGDVECSFPAMTSLKISGMLKLEVWSIPDSMRSFPCLKKLKIESCPELRRLPCLGKLPSLTDLVLQYMNSVMCLGVEWLEDVECSFPALTSLKISGMSKLEDWSIPDSMRSFPCLTKLSIEWCPELRRLPFLNRVSNEEDWSIPELKRVPSVEKLSKSDSNRGQEICTPPPPPIMSCFNCLESLKIDHCDNLRTFPAAILDELPSLTWLTFEYCKKLKPLLGGTLKQVSSLRFLRFWSLPELQGLPECMQQLTSLTQLQIWNCNECFLPDWFGSCLESLSTLWIVNCKTVKWLLDSFSGLKSLTNLVIEEVGELEERCKKAEGEDWPKISHIPYIQINGQVIQDLSR